MINQFWIELQKQWRRTLSAKDIQVIDMQISRDAEEWKSYEIKKPYSQNFLDEIDDLEDDDDEY